jgi:ABC-2 type transport system ATP-binding protein
MSSPIRTDHLSKRFGSSEAVHDLTMEVPEGSIFALLGPNGAGKTTTIKMLMNIIAPSGGSATVLDVNCRKLAPLQLEQIGYVSENQELPEWMTLRYFLKYCQGFYPSWDQALCQKLVHQFDLPLDTKLKNVSRGMRMKAALASSIAYHPRLLILDEPFSGLDALVRDDLIEGVLEVSTDHEWTVFLCSHDLGEIESVASHIGYIDHGELKFAEELASLQGRFREVEVTCETPPSLPPLWPSEWLRPDYSDRVVRFVVTTYSEDSTPAQIRALFPSCRDWNARPLPLRSIFTALAKLLR